MDQLQVLALILEITGIALTVIHIYNNDFSKLVSDRIERAIKYIGLDQLVNMSDGIDYDLKHLADTEREQVFHTRVVTIAFAFLSMPFVYMSVEYGNGLLWGIAEFISAYFLAFICVILAQYLLVLIVNSALLLCRLSGRGDIIIGIGLGLALAGLIIEAFQIYHSSLWWTLLIIVPATILIPCLYLFIKSRTNTNSAQPNN